jgi:hypothetical protein
MKALAFALALLGWMGTAANAASVNLSEKTMAQRLVRAKEPPPTVNIPTGMLVLVTATPAAGNGSLTSISDGINTYTLADGSIDRYAIKLSFCSNCAHIPSGTPQWSGAQENNGVLAGFMATGASPPRPPPPSSGTTYYITPNGSDRADGKAFATAWHSPKHNINCADNIIVQPGNYTGVPFAAGQWGMLQNCPGSADHPYAILKCGGTHIQDCNVVAKGANARGVSAFETDTPYWAIIGFTASTQCGLGTVGSGGTGNGYCYCFAASSHHILHINDYAHDCNWGALNTNAPAVDYHAHIGVLLFHNAWQNIAGGGGCSSNFSFFPGTPFDSNPGPHIFMSGLYSMRAGSNRSCIDGHGLIFDDYISNRPWRNFQVEIAIENSLFLANAIHGVSICCRSNVGPGSHIKNSTVYGNHQYNVTTPDGTYAAAGGGGEVTYYTGGPMDIDNTIIMASVAQQPCATYGPSTRGGSTYIFESCGTYGGTSVVYAPVYAITSSYGSGTITNTDYFGQNGQHYCNSHDLPSGCWPPGNNTYASPTFDSTDISVDPQFVNPTVPIANPDCGQAATTTACISSIIAGFVPQNPAVANMGYRAPGACAPDADWPAWVPTNSNYLPDGLVQHPC